MQLTNKLPGGLGRMKAENTDPDPVGSGTCSGRDRPTLLSPCQARVVFPYIRMVKSVPQGDGFWGDSGSVAVTGGRERGPMRSAPL